MTLPLRVTRHDATRIIPALFLHFIIISISLNLHSFASIAFADESIGTDDPAVGDLANLPVASIDTNLAGSEELGAGGEGREIRSEGREIRNEERGTRDEVQEIRNEGRGTRDEVQEIRGEGREIRNEERGTRDEVQEIRSEE